MKADIPVGCYGNEPYQQLCEPLDEEKLTDLHLIVEINYPRVPQVIEMIGLLSAVLSMSGVKAVFHCIVTMTRERE